MLRNYSFSFSPGPFYPMEHHPDYTLASLGILKIAYFTQLDEDQNLSSYQI